MAETNAQYAGHDPQLLTTYRYLRMSLIALLVMLASAVLIEWLGSGSPLLDSISSYYWTPVRSVFVGGLVALGVGMLVLKPDNELEDIFLNIAGVLAPVVAFVPTPQSGTCLPANADAGGAMPLPASTIDAITNNVGALLAASMLGLLIFVALAFVVPDPASPSVATRIKLARLGGLVVVVLLFVGALVWFSSSRRSFDCNAHYAAAMTLFVCILAIGVLNALAKYLEARHRGASTLRAIPNPYSVIAVLMLLVVAAGFLGHLQDWDYWILFVEAGVLTLFLAFWILQTAELWEHGIRPHVGGRSLLPQPAAGAEAEAEAPAEAEAGAPAEPDAPTDPDSDLPRETEACRADD